MAANKISKRMVDGIPIPVEGRSWVWDSEVKGFGVRTSASGRKVYVLKYRIGAKQAVYTIGTHGSPWTPEKARQAALDAAEKVRRGEDPSAEKVAERKAPTVSELIELYLTEGPKAKPAKRQSSWDNDASGLRRHIATTVGTEPAHRLTHAKAAAAITDIMNGKTAVTEKSAKARGLAVVKGGQGVARRTKAVASAMYTWAAKAGYVTGNPFHDIQMATAPKKERFLSEAEASRLIEALSRLEAQGGAAKAHLDAIRLLLLTGARKTEISALKWSEVDFERSRLVLPPDRTKAGGKTGERRVVLSPAAMQILSRRYDARTKPQGRKSNFVSEYVFASPRAKQDHDVPVVGLRRVFLAATTLAEIDNIRLHDLRHSFASFAVAGGASLFLISKLLGHADSRTTERYAHLSQDPLDDAAGYVAKILTMERH